MRFTITFKDRTANNWELSRINDETVSMTESMHNDMTKIPLRPVLCKLFDQDVFDYIDETTVTIINSPIRTIRHLPGVLMLEHNKIYGKIKRKYYYRFVPNNPQMPTFLVPFLNKKIGFDKYLKNKYALIAFDNWESKHPIGRLVQMIGDVDEPSNFHEYQLHCKQLHISLREFTVKSHSFLKDHSEEECIEMIQKQYTLHDRRAVPVYTIDPEHSTDFDDAFSLQFTDAGNSILSIYIANVPLWMDVMELWDSFSKRVSTIYLPNKKCPMLPSILSDSLCSLQQKKTRFAFGIDIHLSPECEIQSVHFVNSMIQVKRNYVYESSGLLRNPMYKNLFDTVIKMNTHKHYIDHLNDSHDVIAFLMICMNNLCAIEMASRKIGLFRTVKYSISQECETSVPKSIRNFIKVWNSSGGKYVSFDACESHDALNLDQYVHITSPIRRLVDLLNMIQLQSSLGLIDKHLLARQTFSDKWTTDESLEFINHKMCATRRVQNDCAILALCVKDTTILSRIFNGYVIECEKKACGAYKHTIYLPELKLIRTYTSDAALRLHGSRDYKLFLFKNEDNVKQKIMIDVV